MFALADVFDALSSKRPYKSAMPFDAVIDILRKDTGSHFDPRVMSAFERVADEIREKLHDASEADARALLEAQIRKHFTI